MTSHALRFALTVALLVAVWAGVWWAVPLAITLLAVCAELAVLSWRSYQTVTAARIDAALRRLDRALERVDGARPDRRYRFPGRES